MDNINNTQPKLAIALLAAGQATRFGSAKQLAQYQGQTLIQRAIALLEKTMCEILVITGAHHSDISQHLTEISKDQYVVFNQDWQQGMSSSIKTAVRHCPEDCAGIMFITVDQVQITQSDIQSLMQRWQQDCSRIVCAKYAEHKGIPAIFPKSSFSTLLELQDDKGARNIIKSSSNVRVVSMPNAELDIDTVEQLNELMPAK